jgi:hypothetical protein
MANLCGIRDPTSIASAAGLFHNLGTIVYFEKDANLKDMVMNHK